MKKDIIPLAGAINKAMTAVVSYETTAAHDYDATTLQHFEAIENIYNFFRQQLFDRQLGPVLHNMDRRVRCMGYYMANAWVDKDHSILPEITINPATLTLPLEEICRVLVHEMAHHFQYQYGKPSRRGYHNKEFSQIMFTLGLATSTTGAPGGKKTGQRMSEFVLDGGRFIEAFNAMPPELKIPFKPLDDQLLIPPVMPQDRKYNKNKIMYRCPVCLIKVWGKPDLHIICDDCHAPMFPSNVLS